MSNIRYNLMDMLDHQPDLLSDSKIKAMMSDIYDNMIGYVNNNNSDQVSKLIADLGTENFIMWFIDNVYTPNTTDIKIMSYVSENRSDIVGILAQALSNLTPKEVIDNMKEEKVDGADEITEKTGSDNDAIDEIKNEAKTDENYGSSNDAINGIKNDEENIQKIKTEKDIAFSFIDAMSSKEN